MLFITGPTASGKTKRAVDVAKAINGEIISADSRQLYRGMDIGTGKDLCEYGDVPYHLIDICQPGYRYNLFEYLRDFNTAKDSILSRGRKPIVCGGTGLYVESVINGVQLPPVPENKELRESLRGKSLEELTSILSGYKTLHNKTDVDSCQRAIRAIEIAKHYDENPELKALTRPNPIKDAVVIGVDIPREMRRRRISERLLSRIDNGMIDEVRNLIDSGVSPENLIYYGLEYKFVTRHVIGELSRQEMIEQLETAIHQFAKRQMTWFRGMERRGIKINWLPFDLPAEEFVGRVVELSARD